MDCVDEWPIYALFSDCFWEAVAAYGVGFVEVGVDAACFFGEASVEKPIVQWKDSVC